MSEEYEPELGQAFFGNPWSRYKCPCQVEAFVHYIQMEISRIFWNTNQQAWDGTEIVWDGFEWRPYYWGDDEKEMEKPNLKFDEVEIRWYKRPGRGMSTNKDWTPEQWWDWLDRVIKHLRKYEAKKLGEKGVLDLGVDKGERSE